MDPNQVIKARSNHPRIVFAGDRQIAVDILVHLRGQGTEPLGLILPERTQGSHVDTLRAFCNNLPHSHVWIGDQFRSSETIEVLRSLALDYIVCIHFPLLVPASVLAVPRHGVLNLHPAYLPYNRGWHSAVWALLDRTPFGATLHFMNEHIDAGDIVHQRLLVANPRDTGDTLYKRAMDLELEVFKEAWPRLADFSYVRKPQRQDAGTSHKRKDLFLPEVQEIDLDETVRAGDIIDKIRALTTNGLDEASYFVVNDCRYRIQMTITEESRLVGQPADRAHDMVAQVRLSRKIPVVSFVVPCYNYGRYLPDCLSSIFAQEGGYDFEIIAIDDASSDNTRQVLAEFSDPRLRVIQHSRNLGHIATVNEGVKLACGTFIARIDPDDRYRPHFLATTLGKFAEFPEVGLVYGDAALIDDSGRVTVEHSDSAHAGKDFKGNEFVRILERNIICAPTAIARREVWAKALPIPDGLAFNDWYLNLMMARESDFYYVHNVVADYRVHPSNHHTKIIRDGSEEPSILRLLERVFRETEKSSDLEEAKRRAQRTIYGAQYLTLADKYFGMQMNSEARRCYLRAIWNRPMYLARWDVQRHVAATFMGRNRYEVGKSFVRSVFVRN